MSSRNPEARFHPGQFVRSISHPWLELRALCHVPATDSWACQITNGLPLEFPSTDLVAAHITYPKGVFREKHTPRRPPRPPAGDLGDRDLANAKAVA